ncbi:Oidioi.mRNA.OKI2018_I69.chr1.g3336.t1.cds [Oikopleura dioica]|uniref:Phosphorylated adapter RNA export protein n=1 Tax=Oikopleura dioica TaxID=34765 RepID=A0ABN7T2Z6_OIKDI|nr:Oidioi.mRNA.OKI2018_I69.chr1.g3336.t1.cds [Oikopleura dioica]
MPKANLWGDILMEQELTAQLEDALGAMETQGGTFCNAKNFRNKRIRPHQMNQCRKGKEQPGNRHNQKPQIVKKLHTGFPRVEMGVPRILKSKSPLSEEMTSEELTQEIRFRLWEHKLIQLRALINICGNKIAIELMEKVIEAEKEGGVMCERRKQRRLPGGVFIHFLRERTDVDQEEVKKVLDAHRTWGQKKSKNNNPVKHSKTPESSMEAETTPQKAEDPQVAADENQEPGEIV